MEHVNRVVIPMGLSVTLRRTNVTPGPEERHLSPEQRHPRTEQRHPQRHLLLVNGVLVAHRPLAVKVDAPRRRHGWWPFGHGSFLASPSGLRFSLSLRSLP